MPIADESLIDGARRELQKARVFQGVDIDRVVVEPVFDQHPRHGAEQAQFAIVVGFLAAIGPGGIPAGVNVVNQFSVNEVLQQVAVGRGLERMDVGLGATGRSVVAGEAVGVPRDIDRIFAGIFFPLGIDRTYDGVVVRIDVSQPQPLRVSPGLFFPARLAADDGCIRRGGVGQAPSNANRIGQDGDARGVGLVGEIDARGLPAIKWKPPNVAPRIGVARLRDGHGCGGTCMLDEEVGIGGGRTGSAGKPHVDRVNGGERRGECPGGRGQ